MASSGEKAEAEEVGHRLEEGAGSAPSPTARRQQKQRAERMALIKEQVADGTLTIRQMTPKERRENPPRKPSEQEGAEPQTATR